MKKIINYVVIAMMGFAFLGTSSLTAQEWSKDQDAVWQEVKDGWAAWKSGDSDKAFDGIHENYLGWNNKDPLPTSKGKWMRSYEENKEFMKVDYYDIEPARILIEGDNAIIYYYFNFHMVYEKGEYKKESSMEGKNVEFYIKDGNKWKMLGDMTYFESKEN